MKRHTQTWTVIRSLVGVITAGTVTFHFLEDWTWIQAFYFSIVSLTTVGYGDLYPTSDTTRLIASIFLLVGVTIVVSAMAIIGRNYLDSRVNRIQAIKTSYEYKREKRNRANENKRKSKKK